MPEETRSTIQGLLDEEETDDEEAGPAEDFGFKVGLGIGVVAFLVMFVSPLRGLDFSSKSGDLFVVNSSGAEPFLLVAITTLVATLGGSLYYALSGGDRYDGYKSEFAIGAILAPAGVMILQFALILLEPVANKVIVGDIAGAVLFLVIELVVAAILLMSNIGIIVVAIFFGIYLGIPSFVGTYVGGFLGELVST